jgi:hypothetical protein
VWAAFKLLSWKVKAGLIGLALAILLAVIGSTAYVSYQKGLNVSKVEIQKFQNKKQEVQTKFVTLQGKTDVQVVTQFKDRVSYVDRIVYKTRDVVRDSVPQQFNFSRGWIYAYNQSVQGLEVDPLLAADKTPAPVSDVEALAGTIVPNNGICLSTKAQLEALQKWQLDTEANRAEANR